MRPCSLKSSRSSFVKADPLLKYGLLRSALPWSATSAICLWFLCVELRPYTVKVVSWGPEVDSGRCPNLGFFFSLDVAAMFTRRVWWGNAGRDREERCGRSVGKARRVMEAFVRRDMRGQPQVRNSNRQASETATCRRSATTGLAAVRPVLRPREAHAASSVRGARVRHHDV
jgi:hypothetical protein